MARPATDIEAGRSMLLEVLEDMIRRRGAVSFTLVDLANEAGMSPANIYRFFANKEALYEASAERWFTPKIKVMEEVVASDAPIREKFHQFYGRRFRLMADAYASDAALFVSYLDLGDQHEDIVRGYIDLGDHYLAILVAQAQDEEGLFGGLTIDEAVSLLNLSMLSFLHPRMIVELWHSVSEQKLARVLNGLLDGLKVGAPMERPRLAAV